MEEPIASRATTAAISIAGSLGLRADRATVLNNSNKLTLRLEPCDVLARIAPPEHEAAQFEIDLARRLAESGCPVAALEPRAEPRVYPRDGFNISLWTYYESGPEVPPADYADALQRLHAGMRSIDAATPHFTDRVEEAQQVVANRDISPELPEEERELLATALATRGATSPDAAKTNCCTANRTRGTCSPRSRGRSSSTSRPAAAARSSSTSRTRPTRSPTTTPASTANCCASAGSSSSP